MKINFLGGENITHACEIAVQNAVTYNCIVEFNFNEILLKAEPTTDPAQLAKSYIDECDRRRAAWEASPEYKRQQEEYTAKEAKRQADLDAALATAPPHMTLKDADGWAKALPPIPNLTVLP